MSKIGKIPVVIKEGVSVAIAENTVVVKGPKGETTFAVPRGIVVKTADGKVVVAQQDANNDQMKALFGLTRAMIANMITGVSTGFQKKLELSGVGYRAQVSGNTLSLSIGFSHPVKIQAPPDVTFAVADNAIIVSGVDKVLVGNTAAQIRAIRPPEPYKGKGIKYAGERIRKKAGKAAKAVGAITK